MLIKKKKVIFTCRLYNINKLRIYTLGNVLSSCTSHRASESKVSEPDWWAAASETGTYVRSVEIPNPI